jgi:hypothetical protein
VPHDALRLFRDVVVLPGSSLAWVPHDALRLFRRLLRDVVTNGLFFLRC